ncbi:DUF2955 domain-containing protein [Vibrio fluvialis]|nr:DUF2955 domain-containing protein [Vibrio fluvialis]
MFRSCVNPVVKIVFTQILLLFYLKVTGHPLPVLAPIFVVILTTTIPSKPPMNLVLQLVLVLLLTSFVMVFFVQMFAGSPTGFALVCWGIFTWSYHRSHNNPQDIISNLALIVLTTATGILFTIPTMLLCGFGAPEWVAMGVSLFLGIQLACYAIRRDAHSAIYQLLLTNFVVLTYQVIKNAGIDSFSSGIMRLVSISIAIFIGALILRLISPNKQGMESHSESS